MIRVIYSSSKEWSENHLDSYMNDFSVIEISNLKIDRLNQMDDLGALINPF